MRKIISVLLALALVCVCIPTALADDGLRVFIIDPHDWNTDLAVLHNGETFKQSGKTVARLSGNKLYLNGINDACIQVEDGDVEIVVSGVNTLTSDTSPALYVYDGDLTLSGDGRLLLTALSEDGYGIGVFANDDLKVKSGLIVSTGYTNAFLSENGDIEIDGGTVYCYAQEAGVCSDNGDVSIRNATASIYSDNLAIYAAGDIRLGNAKYKGKDSGVFLVNGSLVTTFYGNVSITNLKAVRTYRPGQFRDIDENDWYGANAGRVVAKAYELGLVNGVGDGKRFNPNGLVTIAEALTMASRLHNLYYGGDGKFTQLSPWYTGYSFYSVATGIIEWGEFTEADMNRPATRAEMAHIFARTMPEELLKINNINKLPDVAPGDRYAGDIYALYRAGVLTGSDKRGTFYPNTTITRAAAAAIIARIADPETRVLLNLS